MFSPPCARDSTRDWRFTLGLAQNFLKWRTGHGYRHGQPSGPSLSGAVIKALMKAGARCPIPRERAHASRMYHSAIDTVPENKMIKRFLIAALLLLPASILADDLSKGEDIFNDRCAMCHSLPRTMKLLEDNKLEDRPAYLKKFLRSHPSKLDDDDEDLVIRLLSTSSK
jgi:hypothetical protein